MKTPTQQQVFLPQATTCGLQKRAAPRCVFLLIGLFLAEHALCSTPLRITAGSNTFPDLYWLEWQPIRSISATVSGGTPPYSARLEWTYGSIGSGNQWITYFWGTGNQWAPSPSSNVITVQHRTPHPNDQGHGLVYPNMFYPSYTMTYLGDNHYAGLLIEVSDSNNQKVLFQVGGIIKWRNGLPAGNVNYQQPHPFTGTGAVGSFTNTPGPYPDSLPEESAQWGLPVQLSTGAETFSRKLVSINGAAPFALEAHYHSLLGAGRTGPMGVGWRHNFEISVVPSEFVDGVPKKLTVKRDWSTHIFTREPSSSPPRWFPPANWPTDEVINTVDNGATWVLTTQNRSKYRFASDTSLGRLISIEDDQGRFTDLTYSGGLLTEIRDRISGRGALLSYEGGKLVGVTDAAALQTAALDYSANGLLQNLTAEGVSSSYHYTTNSWLNVVRDQNGGLVMSNAYDGLGRVVSQDDARSDNGLTLFSYDEATRPGFLITSVTDRNGQLHRYTFGQQWLLREYRSPDGQTTKYEYDSSNRLRAVIGADGLVSDLQRTSTGNVSAYDLPGDALQTVAYNTRNRPTTVQDSEGLVTQFQWDTNGRLLSASNAMGLSASFTRDSNGFVRSVLDQSGALTSISNAGGLPQAVVAPTGEQTIFAYDGAGRVISTTLPGSRTTTFAYDSRGLVTNTTYPDGTSVSVGYDHRRRATSITNPSGSLSMSYDGNHNLLSRTDQLGRTTQFAYDGEDRPTSVNLPGGRSISMSYDASGRPVAATDPAGRVRKNEYDSAGRLARVLFPATNSQPLVSYSYNTEGFVSAITDGDGNVQRMGYDASGRVISVTNAAGAVTRFDYDLIGRLTNTVSPAGRVTSALRNDGTRTSVMTDANGNATTMSYDASGRLSSVATQSDATTQYQYNATGDLHRIVEPSGQQAQLAYDSAGRVQSVSDGAGTIAYGYDQIGRLHTVSEGTNTITRLYDALGRLTNYTDVFGNQIGYAYNQAGDLEYLTYPDGTQLRYEYNAAGQVAKITDWDGRITTYSYDSSGRMQSMQRPNGTWRTQTYWNSGRLKSASESGPDATYSWNYTYSPTGLLTNESRLPALPATPTPTPIAFTYGSDNRLANVGGQSVNFDPDGNMTLGPLSADGGLQILRYDARNRLTNAGGISYTYDAENRRVALTSQSAETRFAIDPWPELDRVLVISHPDGSKTKFVHGPGLLYSQKGTEVRFHHFDYRGSTVALTDGSGVVTDTFRYGTYGELLSRIGGSQTPFQFVAQHGVQTDSNGLIHMRARFFSPLIKRFVNQDVLLGESRNGLSMNRFAYANGNPTELIDPFGLAAQDVRGDKRRARIISQTLRGERYSEPDDVFYRVNWSTEESKQLLNEIGTGPLSYLWPLHHFGFAKEGSWQEKWLEPLGWGRSDYKAKRESDTFRLPKTAFLQQEVTLNPAEKGNFKAGYQGVKQAGVFGYFGMRVGGIVYDNKNEWDEDSLRDLRDGALMAAQEYNVHSRWIDAVDNFMLFHQLNSQELYKVFTGRFSETIFAEKIRSIK